jgi:hypothetical protein
VVARHGIATVQRTAKVVDNHVQYEVAEKVMIRGSTPRTEYQRGSGGKAVAAQRFVLNETVPGLAGILIFTHGVQRGQPLVSSKLSTQQRAEVFASLYSFRMSKEYGGVPD